MARTIDVDIKHLTETLQAGRRTTRARRSSRSTRTATSSTTASSSTPPTRAIKADNVLYLEHGKPLIFGKDRNKGIRLNGIDPEVVTLGNGISVDDLLIHDEQAEEPSLAYLLSRMVYPALPGVRRRLPRRASGRPTTSCSTSKSRTCKNPRARASWKSCSPATTCGLWIRW